MRSAAEVDQKYINSIFSSANW